MKTNDEKAQEMVDAFKPLADLAKEPPKPLEPSERIELEMFKRVLQDVVEGDDDIAQIFTTASDLILSGAMGKDDALRGAITCLVVRVKTFKNEARALHVENSQWRDKWVAAQYDQDHVGEFNETAWDLVREMMGQSEWRVDDQDKSPWAQKMRAFVSASKVMCPPKKPDLEEGSVAQ